MTLGEHKWSEDDDIVAFYLYRYGEDGLSLSLSEIGSKLGMGLASLKMRIDNFRSLDGGPGLDNWSKQSERNYNKYKGMSEVELKAIVLRILGN